MKLTDSRLRGSSSGCVRGNTRRWTAAFEIDEKVRAASSFVLATRAAVKRKLKSMSQEQ